MGTQPRKKDRTNKERRGRRKGGARPSFKSRISEYSKPNCGICGEPIKDITSALARPEDTAPVHFDCALDIQKELLKPQEGETVIYLGRGSFAVVDAEEYKKRRLKIIRRTDWETPESPPSWRKDLTIS